MMMPAGFTTGVGVGIWIQRLAVQSLAVLICYVLQHDVVPTLLQLDSAK